MSEKNKASLLNGKTHLYKQEDENKEGGQLHTEQGPQQIEILQ
jgi:hypothetical protein